MKIKHDCKDCAKVSKWYADVSKWYAELSKAGAKWSKEFAEKCQCEEEE